MEVVLAIIRGQVQQNRDIPVAVLEPVVDVGSVFFSSRRRHTRYWRDWSSDVCSSDLVPRAAERLRQAARRGGDDRARRLERQQLQRQRGAVDHLAPTPRVRALAEPAVPVQIGRASCRERVYISVAAASLKKKRSPPPP